MNKSDIISGISERSGLTKADSERAFNAFLEVAMNALNKSEDVSIVGFGTFSVKKTPARKGRNFKTGSTMLIPAGKSVKFKPGKNLKNI